MDVATQQVGSLSICETCMIRVDNLNKAYGKQSTVAA